MKFHTTIFGHFWHSNLVLEKGNLSEGENKGNPEGLGPYHSSNTVITLKLLKIPAKIVLNPV